MPSTRARRAPRRPRQPLITVDRAALNAISARFLTTTRRALVVPIEYDTILLNPDGSSHETLRNIALSGNIRRPPRTIICNTRSFPSDWPTKRHEWAQAVEDTWTNLSRLFIVEQLDTAYLRCCQSIGAYLQIQSEPENHIAYIRDAISLLPTIENIVFDGQSRDDPSVLEGMAWSDDADLNAFKDYRRRSDQPTASLCRLVRDYHLTEEMFTVFCSAVARSGWRGNVFRAYGLRWIFVEDAIASLRDVLTFANGLLDLALKFEYFNWGADETRLISDALCAILESARDLKCLEIGFNGSLHDIPLDQIVPLSTVEMPLYPRCHTLKLRGSTQTLSFFKTFLRPRRMMLKYLSLRDIALAGDGDSWVDFFHFLSEEMDITRIRLSRSLTTRDHLEGWFARNQEEDPVVGQSPSCFRKQVVDCICQKGPRPFPHDSREWPEIGKIDDSFGWCPIPLIYEDEELYTQ